jgi:hypothetical protein
MLNGPSEARRNQMTNDGVCGRLMSGHQYQTKYIVSRRIAPIDNMIQGQVGRLVRRGSN